MDNDDNVERDGVERRAKAREYARRRNRLLREKARLGAERAARIEAALLDVQAVIEGLYADAVMSAAARDGLRDCIRVIARARFPKAKPA